MNPKVLAVAGVIFGVLAYSVHASPEWVLAAVFGGPPAWRAWSRAGTCDGGPWFEASEPVEKSGEDGQRDADRRGVARIVEVADCQSEVIERGHGVAVFGFE